MEKYVYNNTNIFKMNIHAKKIQYAVITVCFYYPTLFKKRKLISYFDNMLPKCHLADLQCTIYEHCCD